MRYDSAIRAIKTLKPLKNEPGELGKLARIVLKRAVKHLDNADTHDRIHLQKV